jgi:long-chain acyl-CoA synthetase
MEFKTSEGDMYRNRKSGSESGDESAPWIHLYDPQILAAEPSPQTNILSVFRRSVMDRGDAIAIRYFDGQISYRQLDQLSDTLAATLNQSGTQPGQRIAVLLQNVPSFAVIFLAAWKLDLVVVPINPTYSADELTLIFGDSSPRCVFCETGNLAVVGSALEKAGVQAVVFGSAPTAFQSRNDPRVFSDALRAKLAPGFEADMFAQEASPPRLQVSGTDLAMIMYTSGSTGRPKGVMILHANILFSARTIALWWRLDANSVILGLAPLFHITGMIVHACAAIYVSCPLVLTYRMVPDVILDSLRENRPTFTAGATTAFIALMNIPGARPEHFASLRYVVCGGAPLPPAVRDQVKQRIGIDLYPGYGMTETTAPTHQSPIGQPIPVDPASGALAVGIPVPETQVRIVGDRDEILAAGLPGEVWVRGPQVMAGYWNLPEETEKVLTDGWMHTGDVGVMDRSGWLYLVDRKKDVIIASGYKVWPREVEDRLYKHPGVREAAVVGAPDDYRGETVIAFVSLKPNAAAVESELIDHCRNGLAPYKCPRRVITMTDLPKTVSGKIQRHRLRQCLTEGILAASPQRTGP